MRVLFENSMPDFLQNSVNVTGEFTTWLSCILQCRMNLLPAYGIPTVGENRLTAGVGTVGRKIVNYIYFKKPQVLTAS